MSLLLHRLLGSSGIEVSRLALGSWRTFERISHEPEATATQLCRKFFGVNVVARAAKSDEVHCRRLCVCRAAAASPNGERGRLIHCRPSMTDVAIYQRSVVAANPYRAVLASPAEGSP